MKTAILIRTETSDQGTFGYLFYNGRKVRTVELPWRENKRSRSCIPKGEYICEVRQSPRFGRVYHITNVEGRSYILFHSGNFAGDVEKGWKSNSHGCVLPGRYSGKLANQKAVLASRFAVTDFVRAMKGEKFKLIIEELY